MIDSGGLTLFLGLTFIFVLYFLPWFVAAARNHRNWPAIAVMNLLLGWTLLGWIGALIWATTNDVEARGETAVREKGRNL